MIFLDTSLLVAYAVSGDSNHDKAVTIVDDIAAGKFGKAVTSDYVFDETVTVILVRTKSLERSVRTGELIKESVELWKADEAIFELAWKLFSEQKATKFSFTDCTIIAQVSLNGVDLLATFDGEFDKAGFSVVKT